MGLNMNIRFAKKNRAEIFHEKDTHKIFAKSTGKHLRISMSFSKSASHL